MKKYISIAIITYILLAGCSPSRYETKDKPSSNNPCNDKVLSQLERKDSLTTDEMRIYVELKSLCDNSKNSERAFNQTEKSTDAYSTPFYISIIAGLISLAWLFTL